MRDKVRIKRSVGFLNKKYRAFFMIFVAVLVVGGFFFFQEPLFEPHPIPLQLLKREADSQRCFPLRLAWSSPHRPMAAAAGAVRDWPKLQLDSLTRAKIEQALTPRSDGDIMANLQLRLLWSLLVDVETDHLKYAVADLESAWGSGILPAGLLNDLAVGYWLLAKIDENPLMLLRALKVLRASLKQRPGSAIALFNLGFLWRELGLPLQARETWRQCLEIESAAAWREEIETRVRALPAADVIEAWASVKPEIRRAIATGNPEFELASKVDEFRSGVRLWFERELLIEWAQGDEEALATAAVLARYLLALNGDRLYLDTVDNIASATPARRANLKQAFLLFKEGLDAYSSNDYEVASAHFLRSKKLMEDAGNGFRNRLDYYIHDCSFNQQQYEPARANMQRIEEEASGRDYINLAGEASWVEGLSSNHLGHPADTERSYRRALERFEKSGDLNNLAGVHFLLFNTLNNLGERRAGWRHLRRALSLLPRVSDARRHYQIYLQAVYGAWWDKQTDLALAYAERAVYYARKSRNNWAINTALLWQARILHQAGRTDEVAGVFGQVRDLLTLIPDEKVVSQIEMQMGFAEGEMESDPVRSAEILQRALDLTLASQNLASHPFLLPALARAYRKSGDLQKAEEFLRWTIDLFESRREDLRPALREVFFINEVADVYDEMIDLCWRRGEKDLAFNYSEKKRARILLDQVELAGLTDSSNSFSARHLSLVEIQKALPETVTLVVFAAEKERLLVWIIRHHAMTSVEISGSLEEVQRHVARFRQRVEHGGSPGSLLKEASALYELILAPIAGSLLEDGTLVFIPDGPLHEVPFAALRGPDGRFLVESHTISISPSANIYLKCLQRDEYLHVSRPNLTKLLLIGATKFDRQAFPELGSLPNLRREIDGIRNLFGDRATVLMDLEATQERFFRAAVQSEVIHLGGHALINLQLPERSRLILAAATGDSEHGAVFVHELRWLQLAYTRLVVLSACSTALGPVQRGEGVANFVRPFIAAGVPCVIASPWKVRDRSTAELMLRFYRYLNDGKRVAQALRLAQLSFIHGESKYRSPAHWAPFQVFGYAATLMAGRLAGEGTPIAD